MPEVHNLKENARVQFNDVLIGNVAKVERQGWHALVTMTIEPNVDLPANATATIGRPACWERCMSNWVHPRASRQRASCTTVQ